MAETKIDEQLLEEIKKFIKKGENRFDFPSVKSFIDKAVFNTLKSLKEKEKEN